MAVNKNFVVKNGFEVNTDLILANASSRKVGIASTNPRYLLDVRGGIGVTDIYSVGVTTVVQELNVGVGGTTFTVIGSGGPSGIGSIGIGTDGPRYLLHVSAPVSTGQTALYVRGDMLISGDIRGEDDLFLDEVTVRNINVTGVSTIPQLVVTGLTSSISLNAGFSTFRENVFFQKDIDVDGHAEFDNVRISGIATIQTLDAVSLAISGVAATNITASGNLFVSGISTFQNFVTINNQLRTQGFRATGVSTFTNYLFSDVQFTTSNLNVTGFSTFGQNVNATKGIDVTGHTELDNVNISGMVTAANANIDGGTIDNVTIGGAIRGAGNFTTLNANGSVVLGDATADTITATGRFASDLTPSTSGTRNLGESTLEWNNLYIDGHAEFDNANFSGIVTTSSIKISSQIQDQYSNVGAAGSILVSTGGGWKWEQPNVVASAAGGSNRQIQFNNSGSLGGSNNLRFEVDNTLGVVGLVSATRFKSFVATGAVPFECTSTTLNTNLNADLLDDQQGSYYLDYNNFTNKPTIPTVNNGTLSLSVSGTGLSGTASFTANQSGNSTFTVTSNATSDNTNSAIVARNAAGGFSAGIITATTLNATTITKVGGTSNQFLKADGSVDSTVYVGAGKAIAMAIVFG